MAVTSNTYTVGGSGQAGPYSYAFPIIADADVKVSVNGTVKSVTTHYTLDSSNTRITFVSGQEPSTGDKVIVYRDTDEDPINSTFVSGSTIRSNELNDNFNQLLYIAQESDNQSLSKLGGVMEGDLGLGLKNDLYFEGDTDNAYETTLTVVDPTADRTITLPNVTGTVVTTGDTGTVAHAMLAGDAVDGDNIANDSINSEHYVDGSIDTAHIGNSQVTGAKIADDTIGAVKLQSNSVTTAKIATDAVTNVEIAGSTILSSNIADQQVITAKLADNAVTTVKIANDAITATQIADNAVERGQILNDAVNGSKIADDSIDSEHYVDGSIDSVHIADGAIVNADVNASAAIAGTKISPDFGSQDIVTTGHVDIGDASQVKIGAGDDLSLYHDASTGHSWIKETGTNELKIASTPQIGIISADASKTAATFNTDGGGVKLFHNNAAKFETTGTGATVTGTLIADLADDSIDSEHIVNNAVTVANIADAELTTLAGMQSGTASVLADSTALAATTTEINSVCENRTSETTITDSDAKIPTSGAVVDYVAAQLAPIGGLEVIATDAAFPNTQPAAGVVISIADAGGLVVASGTSTTGRTVGSSTVTINNIASNFNGTTVDPGVAFMVSSTGSGHIYNYHKATLKEADLLSLSVDINDFAERYRVSADPDNLPNKDEGDLVYDTNANKMKVYDNSTSAWKEVTSTGDFKYLFLCPAGGSGAPTLQGNATFDLRESSNSGSAASVTSAAQLIVSVNGVIQKANTGTSAPSEGFALVDANTIIFGANLASGDSVFIVQVGSAVSIPTPGDNTVSTAKIQNLAVNTTKLAADSVDGSKISDDAINSEHYVDGSIDTAHIADDAVNADKLANSINTEIAANTAKTTNATHTGEVTGATALTIADDVVDEANLKVSNSPTNGYFLSAQSGNTGGLTWAEAGGGVSSDAQQNTLAGTNAGDSFTGTDANQNSLFGYNAGTGITTADENVYVGYNTGQLSDTGSYNVAIGSRAFDAATSAGWSVAVGRSALSSVTTGNDNTAVGNYAGGTLDTGHSNVAVGKNALYAATTGSKNAAIGMQALQDLTTGSENYALGYEALKNIEDGNYNIGIGGEAGHDNVSGGGNIAIGHKAWDQSVGSNNVAIGYEAASASCTGMNGMVAIGYRAAYTIANDGGHLAIGHEALKTCATGIRNTAVGFYSQRLCTGSQNTTFGFYSGVGIGSGSRNTMLGHETGQATNIGNDNTFVGYNAAYLTTEGNENVAVGNTAMYQNATGDENTAIGGRAMYGSGSNNESFKNVVVGYESGEDLTTGSYNTFVGAVAAHEATTSNNNVAVGINAGGTLTTGANNIFIGHEAGYNQVSTGDNSFWIARGGTGHGATAVWLSGDSSGNVYRTGGGTAFTSTSDERIKKNISDNNEGLSLIKQLRVRNFEWKTEAEIDRTVFGGSANDPKYTKEEAAKLDSASEGEYKRKYGLDVPGTHVGLIAQELEAVKAKWVNTTEEGKKTIDPSELTWVLVNAVKELSTKNDALEARIAKLEAG